MLERLEWELMLLARHHVMVRADRSEERLNHSAYLLLSRLESQGPMTIGELAEAFKLDTSTVNRQTAALLRDGLARRVADPDGGLARRLQVTEVGAERLRADREINLAGLGRVLDTWEPDELEQLESVLTRLNKSIETWEGRPWPRPGTEAGTASASGTRTASGPGSAV